MLWALPGLVLVAGLVALGLRVHGASKALARRTRAVLADPLEPPSPFPSVVSQPAVHVRTVFASERVGPPFAWAGVEGAVRLEVTERELLVQAAQPTHLPLKRIEEAALVGAFEDRAAPAGGALLRIGWSRGGERLWSVFRFERWPDAEKVRRELHVRLHRDEGTPP